SVAFMPSRVDALRSHIQEITDSLLDSVLPAGHMEAMKDFAIPLPAIVTAEMLGVPRSDRDQLTAWSTAFAEMLANFQHNRDRAPKVLQSVDEMSRYFRSKIKEMQIHPTQGLIHSLCTAEVDGDRLSEEEVIANSIVTMVGGQETTTNLIGNGLLTLLRNPEQM